MDAITDRQLAQELATQLAGVSRVRWGFSELESAEVPPSLPLVVLQRTFVNAAAVLDMCDPDGPAKGDTTVQTRAWASDYESARALNTSVRAVVRSGGWSLMSESDLYDPTFRAWCITGEYLSAVAAIE